MKLFKYEGYEITISEEALLLKPFKAIWDRDKSKNKYTALQELGYIYFMEDPRSDYISIPDREERSKRIKEGEGMKDKWEPDKLIEDAMSFYSEFKSEATLLLEDLRLSIYTIRKNLIQGDDLSTVEIEKKPLVLKAYTETVDKLMSLAKKLDETEKAIARDLTMEDKVRGSAEKAMLEDD